MTKRALVISGGGARGAWGGGLAQALHEVEKKEYDLYVGTSTGALIVPIAAAGAFQHLRNAYTSVTPKSIFNVNPFNKKGGVKFLNIAWRLITKKETFGESKPLRKLVDKFFLFDHWIKIQSSEKEVAVCCVNLDDKKVYYKSSLHTSYEDFKDWIWASSNAPVWMSIVHKDDHSWTDGGIIDHIPIQYAIDQGSQEIDVIVHRPELYKPELDKWTFKSVISLFLRIIDVLSETVSRDDISLGKLQSRNRTIDLNIYYMKEKYVENTLAFDTESMKRMWQIGYNIIVDKDAKLVKMRLTKGNVLKPIR